MVTAGDPDGPADGSSRSQSIRSGLTSCSSNRPVGPSSVNCIISFVPVRLHPAVPLFASVQLFSAGRHSVLDDDDDDERFLLCCVFQFCSADLGMAATLPPPPERSLRISGSTPTLLLPAVSRAYKPAGVCACASMRACELSVC